MVVRIPPDTLGLDDARGVDRSFYHPLLSVAALPADRLDVGSARNDRPGQRQMTEHRPFGIVGMFRSSDAILAAARHLRDLGYREVEAYTPFPVEGLDQILRPGRRVWLPLLMFVAGLISGFWGYFIQWWDEAWSYPINVGGRPYNSWPAFIVSAFEIMLLVAI